MHEVEIVDLAGRPLRPRERELEDDAKEPNKTWVGLILGSTTAIAFATAVLFYIGYVYYSSYFGSFGGELSFPPMGTSDYITKAFVLISSDTMMIVWSLWIGNLFIFSKATRERFYRTIGENAIARRWLFREIDELLVRFLHSVSEGKMAGHPNIRLWERKYEYEVKKQIVRKMKYKIDFESRLYATLLNLPFWGTVLVVAVSLGRMGELTVRRLVWIGIVVSVLLISSLTRIPLSIFFRRLIFSKGVDKYGVMFSTAVLVFSASRLLAESVGEYDARLFVAGGGDGAYVSLVSGQQWGGRKWGKMVSCCVVSWRELLCDTDR